MRISDVLNGTVIKVAPVFAYGTLRPGEGLDYLLAGDTLRVEPATLSGHRMYASDVYGYPRVVRTDSDETVTGEVLWVRVGDMLRWTLEMEERSGYDIVIVNAHTANEAELLPVILCMTGEPAPGGHWVHVPSGDWKDRPWKATYTFEEAAP